MFEGKVWRWDKFADGNGGWLRAKIGDGAALALVTRFVSQAPDVGESHAMGSWCAELGIHRVGEVGS